MTPHKAALYGFLILVPFIVLNFIVSLQIEPLYSFIDMAGLLFANPWLLIALVGPFPIAFFVTIQPMLRKDAGGRHHFYILNAILGTLILAATIFLWHGLAKDIISCDILKIPNCD